MDDWSEVWRDRWLRDLDALRRANAQRPVWYFMPSEPTQDEIDKMVEDAEVYANHKYLERRGDA